MEQEKSKRGREFGDHTNQKESSEMNIAKKRHVDKNDNDSAGGEATSSRSTTSDNSFLPLEVFDFPWLKDSLISKSVDWKFEDNFSSVLNETTNVDTVTVASTAANFDTEFPEHSLGENHELLLDLPEEKFEENVWWPFEGDGLGTEGVDCVCSGVL